MNRLGAERGGQVHSGFRFPTVQVSKPLASAAIQEKGQCGREESDWAG